MSRDRRRLIEILRCAECGKFWLFGDESRWQADPDDDDDNVVFFCPECAEREFADDTS